MSEARELLKQRSSEIRAMQRFITHLDRGTFSLGGAGLLSFEESLVQNCIKATFVMMIYNLAEAIVVSTIHEIFQRVRNEGWGYESVVEEIRFFWIERRAIRIKNGGVEKHAELIKDAIDSALRKQGLEPFDREEIRRSYLGNVDGRLIRQISENFAFPMLPHSSAHGGRWLLQIKETRNNLGHGIYSFSEVGSNLSASDLRDMSIRVRRFLMDTVQAFERYLSIQSYAVGLPT